MKDYPSPFEHIVYSQQFDEEYLFELFALADTLRQEGARQKYRHALQDKVIAMLFFEPSTRTWLAFQTAIAFIGGHFIGTENAKQTSSLVKGETLEDMIRVVSEYCDAIVIRHTDDDSSKRALATARVPIINAGSGKSQHPTQALLDVYTIFRKFGRLGNFHIAVVGDLLHGRTCDSLVYLLSKFPGNTFSFVAPETCRIKKSLRDYLTAKDIPYQEYSAMNSIIGSADVVYVVRVQKERFAEDLDYENVKGSYILTPELANTMKVDAIIMHPLPRNDEIAPEVDQDPRAIYFEQAGNGGYIRAALLLLLLERDFVPR